MGERVSKRSRRGTFPFLISAFLCIVSAIGLWNASTVHALPWGFSAGAGIALLWMLVRRATLLRAFFWGSATGFIYFYLCFDWAYTASSLIAARIALSAVEALSIGVTAMLWAGLWRFASHIKHWWSIAVMLVCSGGAWAGMEIMRSHMPFGGLPWNLLGYSLVDSPFIHLASLGSTELVGAACIVAAMTAVLSIRNALTLHPLRALSAGIVCIGISLGSLLIPFGYVQPAGTVRAGIVQGSAPEISSTGSSSADNWSLTTTRNHVSAAETILAQHPDLIIFPESTSEADYRIDTRAHELISGLSRKAGVPLLLGTQRYFTQNHSQQEQDSTRIGDDVLNLVTPHNGAETERGERGEEENTVRTNDYVIHYPHTDFPTSEDTYSKQHPVPFGEYIPLRSLLGNLTDRLDDISIDMVAGEKPARLSIDLADGRVLEAAVPICFEVAYSDIVSEGVRGADILIVPTSNVTFGHSSEAYQQFMISRFRAAEHGRTAIQVSTTGISGAIRPDGSVIYHTDLFESDARVLNVQLYDGVTLAASSYEKRTYITLAVLSISVAVAGSACIVWPRKRVTTKTANRLLRRKRVYDSTLKKIAW